MEKPVEILDREREWGRLRRAFEGKRPELIFVLGRRRVGKSFVLSRFARECGGVYYQATRRTEAEQLASLSRVLGEHFDDGALQQGAVLPSWEDLFRYLTKRAGSEPFLLVLDEFPYLAGVSEPLTSIVQRFWDHEWADSRIRLVLAGSYITAMKQLEEQDQPLYGRRTAKLSFAPFGYEDAAAFVPGWSARDRFLLYGTVGHLPGHLALVDPDRTLEENVSELMLDPGGRLTDEAEHFLDAFVPDGEVHYSIIEAIATGQRTWSGITNRIGKSGGSLQRPLQWLEEMGIVERVVPVTERGRGRSKRAVYRIADPHLNFWHSMISPLIRRGSVGLAEPEHLWRRFVEPRLDEHMGGIFERICAEFIARSDAPFRPVELGSWWDGAARHEVDIVALSADHQLLVGECKWGAVSRKDLETLRERSRMVAAELPEVGEIHLALFTGRGEADREVLEAAREGKVLLFGPEELLS